MPAIPSAAELAEVLGSILLTEMMLEELAATGARAEMFSMRKSGDARDFLEDDNDDYYNDDDNYGGRKNMGKVKGDTPRDHQKQNEQVDVASRGKSPDFRRKLHMEISGEGGGFHDVMQAAADLAKEIGAFFIGLLLEEEWDV